MKSDPREIERALPRYGRAVLRRARAITGDPAAAPGVARAVFERAQRDGALTAPDVFDRLHALTTERAVARLRGHGAGPLDDRVAPLRREIARLHGRDAALMVCLFIDRMSIEQATAVTGRPRSAVERSSERFRKSARARLARAGASTEAVDDPPPSRTPHASDYDFDRLIADGWDPPSAARIEQHARFCPPCGARLIAVRAASDPRGIEGAAPISSGLLGTLRRGRTQTAMVIALGLMALAAVLIRCAG